MLVCFSKSAIKQRSRQPQPSTRFLTNLRIWLPSVWDITRSLVPQQRDTLLHSCENVKTRILRISNSGVHKSRAINLCTAAANARGSLVCNFLYITRPTPRILRWRLHISKICAPCSHLYFDLTNLGGMIIKFTEEQATKAQRGVRISTALSLISSLYGGGWSTPRPGRFTPGKDPVPIYIGSWLEPGPVRKISPPTEIRSSDRQAHNESLYRLSYFGPQA
jgi:hypothetical protein